MLPRLLICELISVVSSVRDAHVGRGQVAGAGGSEVDTGEGDDGGQALDDFVAIVEVAAGGR